MGNVVREFMTHWNDKAPIWFERDEDELVGTQRSGGRPIPRIRMADLFRGYTNAPGNQPDNSIRRAILSAALRTTARPSSRASD